MQRSFMQVRLDDADDARRAPGRRMKYIEPGLEKLTDYPQGPAARRAR